MPVTLSRRLLFLSFYNYINTHKAVVFLCVSFKTTKTLTRISVLIFKVVELGTSSTNYCVND